MQVAGFFVYLWLMPITTQDITGTLTFVVSSDMRSGTVTYTGTTDYASFGILLANVVETITITAPDGFNLATITVNPSVSRVGSTALIPNSDGLQAGAYTLVISAAVTGPTTPGTYESRGYRTEFCPGNFKPVVKVNVNCKCGAIEVTDESNYTDWTLVSRALSLTCPPVTGGFLTLTTANSFLSSSPNQVPNNVTYLVKLVVTITNGVTTITDLTLEKHVPVDCMTICDMQCALSTVLGKYQAVLGKDAAKAQGLWNAYLAGSVIAANFSAKMDCGAAEATLIDAFWLVLKDTGVNKDCCNCCEGSEFINPSCGSATPEGGNYTFATQPEDILVVTRVGNDLLHTIVPDMANIIRNARKTEVVCLDDSIEITFQPIDASPIPIDRYIVSRTGQEYYWRFRFSVFFDALTYTIGSTTFSHHQRFPATGFWSAADPVIDTRSFGAFDGMRIRNLFDDLAAVHPTMYAVIKMVFQQARLAHRVPTIGVNAVADILFQTYQAAASVTAVDLSFQDLRSDHPVYGKVPLRLTGAPITFGSPPETTESVASMLESMSFQVELRMPRP